MTKTGGDHSRRFCTACSKFIARGIYWDNHVAGTRHKANVGRQRKCAFKSPNHYRQCTTRCAKTVTPLKLDQLLASREGVIDYSKYGCVTRTYGATAQDIKMLCAKIESSDQVYFVTKEVMQEEQEQEQEQETMETDTGTTEEMAHHDASQEPDKSIRRGFADYVSHASSNYVSMHPELRAAVELMKMLDDSGCSVALYDKIMDWHMQNLRAREKITSKKLHDRLVERYNLGDTLPKERRIKLPHSKLVTKIPCHDAAAMVRCMLTDPCLTDNDYLFFNDNPLEAPPPEFDTVADINSGLCYRETYKKLIEPQPYTQCGRRRILMPVIWYFDGSPIGAFSNLSLQVLKMTVGIFGRDYRNKDYAWHPVCYVPSMVKGKGKAKELVEESGHVDAQDYVLDPDFWRGGSQNIVDDTPDFDATPYQADSDDEPEVPECHQLQDFHQILHAGLASYRALQNNGFEWDLQYRGKTYKLHCVPFTMFIKGDGKEQNKHNCMYGPKTRGIKNPCWECTWPMDHADEPYFDLENPGIVMPKTKAMIQNLVKQNVEANLKAVSQHPVWNSWHEIIFGLHNDSGIHGSSPLEILHWILLGQYKYSREGLFLQTGYDSKLGIAINESATSIGILLQRCSDKDLPRTTFSRGLNTSGLGGHEMTGMILCLTATLRSAHGRNLIMNNARGKQKGFFPDDNYIRDWINLLETQLQFEEWLKLSEIPVTAIE